MRYVLVAISIVMALAGLAFGSMFVSSDNPLAQALAFPFLLIGAIALSGVTICTFIEASTQKIVAAIEKAKH